MERCGNGRWRFPNNGQIVPAYVLDQSDKLTRLAVRPLFTSGWTGGAYDSFDGSGSHS